MNIIRANLLALCMASTAFATVKVDPLAGTWRDDFTDLAGLSFRQQASQAYPTGVTVDSSLQYWVQPASTSGIVDSFSSGTTDSGAAILQAGTSRETVSLFRRKLNPLKDMFVNEKCSVSSDIQCSLPPKPLMSRRNGESVTVMCGIPDDPPGEDSVMEAWGLKVDAPKCAAAAEQTPCLLDLYGESLIYGANDRTLTPGQSYNFTFLPACTISATCTGCSASDPQLVDPAYVDLRVVDADTAAVIGSVKVSTTVFPAAGSQADMGTYPYMVPMTLHAAVPAATRRLDYPVVATSTNIWDKFCFSLGPVVVTADKGRYESRVLDTLSDKTRWVDISWDMYQCTGYSDSGQGWNLELAPASTTPMTPVGITYSVSNYPAITSATTWGINHYNWEAASIPPPLNAFTVKHTGTAMCDSAGGVLQGRYYRYSLDLLSRSTAASVDPSLAPGAIHPKTAGELYFGGLRPHVRRMTARYYACAAEVVSRPIAPGSVKSWGTVSFRANKPSAGASVVVDVLAADGTVLKAGVQPGDSLSTIDPYRNPSIKLRALLSGDPANCSMRPELEYWSVDWEPIPEVLVLDRNGIRPRQGDIVRGQVRVDEGGHVSVKVHDAAGQSVKVLLDEERPAQAVFVTWNGRNERGETVAPGIYFITATVPGGKKVRRVAVIR